MSLTKQKSSSAALQLTPRNCYRSRSRHKSTMLLPELNQYAGAQNLEIDILPHTPDIEIDDEITFPKIPFTLTESIQPRSLLKPRLLLPTIIPTIQMQGEEGPHRKAATPVAFTARGRAANLDMSGVGLLTPEFASVKKANDKRKSRRSNISRDQFLSFVFQKEASPPPVSAPEPGAKVDMEILSYDSDSSDDGWEALKNSDGSMKKLLPKSDSVLSANKRSRTKKQASTPKSKVSSNQPGSDIGVKDLKAVGLASSVKKAASRRRSCHPNIASGGSSFNTAERINSSRKCEVLAKGDVRPSVEDKAAHGGEESLKNNLVKDLTVKQSRNLLVKTFAAGRKRKIEEDFKEVSKRVKHDTSRSTHASALELKNSFRPPLKTLPTPHLKRAETLAMAPIRFSAQVQYVTEAEKSPTLSRCPTDPAVQKSEKTVLENLTDLTKKAHILTGIVIFVDFRSENENRGNVLKKAASDLGATIADKLVSTVTHVIFKDGSRITYQKAKKAGLHILSAGWLEESKKEGKKMTESEFPSVSLEKYDTPGLFPRMKKMKSMQPKTLYEDFEAASKAHDRKQKMMEKKLLKEKEAKKLKNPVLKIKYPPHEHYYKGSPHDLSKSKKSRTNLDSSLKEVLKEFQTLNGTPLKLERISNPNLLSPTSPSDCDFDTPLARRLANKYHSPAVIRNILPPDSSPALQGGVESRSLAAVAGLVGDLNSSLNSDRDTPLKLRKVKPRKVDHKPKCIPDIFVNRETPVKPCENMTDVDKSTGISGRGLNHENVDNARENDNDVEAYDEPARGVRRSPRAACKARRKSADVTLKTSDQNKQSCSKITEKTTSRPSKFQTPFKPTFSHDKTENCVPDELSAGVVSKPKPTFVVKKRRFVLSKSTKPSSTFPDEGSFHSSVGGSKKRKLEESPCKVVGQELQAEDTPSKKLRV